MTGYPSKKPEGPAKIENYAGYGKNAPEAAKALRGTNTLEGIKQATEARRRHNESLSRGYTGPRGPAIGRDAK
jgi:hypothetical protein